MVDNAWMNYNMDTSKIILTNALKIATELKNDKWIARTHFQLGVWYSSKSLLNEAMKYYLSGLALFEKLRMKNWIGKSKLRIGRVLDKQELPDEARKYYSQSLLLFESLEDSVQIANSLGNLANTYSQADYLQSIKLYEKQIMIYSNNFTRANERKMAISLGNIANKLIVNNVELDRAKEAIYKANFIWNKDSIYQGVAWNDVRIGRLFIQTNEFDSAIFHLNRCYSKSIKYNWMGMVALSYNSLSEAYYGKGMYKKAYDVISYGRQIEDSLFGSETTEKLINMSANYEEEKAKIIKENKEREEARFKAEEIRRRNNLEYSLIFL